MLNPWVGEHIYCHPQIDWFIVSQFFSMVKPTIGFKPKSKPSWLLHQSAILPQSHLQSQYKWRDFLHISFYIWVISYQSTQFMRRVYIYIYIFTNQISTSIHGTRKKQTKKKTLARNKRKIYLEARSRGKRKKFFG